MFYAETNELFVTSLVFLFIVSLVVVAGMSIQFVLSFVYYKIRGFFYFFY